MQARDRKFIEKTIAQYEEIEREIDKIRDDAKIKIGIQKDDQDDVIGVFVDAGGNRRVIKTLLRQRAMERKAEGLRDKLPDADKDELDNLKLRLGVLADMPLGVAALANAQDEGVRH